MLWETIGRLKGTSLPQRSAELNSLLASFGNEELIQFQREAVSAYRSAFTQSLHDLYCAAFDGEVNGMGLADFCSNIMLAGQPLFEAVLENPDRFVEVVDEIPFNDEYISIADEGRTILEDRLGSDAVEEMCERGELPTLSGVWEDLTKQMGKVDLVPKWSVVREAMPRVFARWGPKMNEAG